MRSLLIIDGHAIIHRAYHALPPLTSNGIPVNAVHGFFVMVHRAIAELAPTHLVIAFDTPVPTFRKQLLLGYQATRPPPPDALKSQFSLIRELVDVARMNPLEAPGFEADDVIGTLAMRVHGTGTVTRILTGDKDILQLVRDDIFVVMPKTGLSTTVVYTPEAVRERFGLPPESIPDLKALIGDPSDNYQSVKGIGPKTAAKLLAQFGTIEGIYERLPELADEKLRSKLADAAENVRKLKYIATIRQDAPVDVSLEQVRLQPYPVEFRERLIHYGFRSLLKRYFPESAAGVQIQKDNTTNMPENSDLSTTPKKKKPNHRKKPDTASQMDLF
ncbi:MAG: hypothetical protein N2691_01655 [Patescibacteria group bacterium]|nr:hypothetical protein [Patescibacteria group bacterium]